MKILDEIDDGVGFFHSPKKMFKVSSSWFIGDSQSPTQLPTVHGAKFVSAVIITQRHVLGGSLFDSDYIICQKQAVT